MTNRKKVLLGGFGILLAVLVGAGIVIARRPNALQAELAKARAQGILVEDGIREPLPDHENAAVALKELLAPEVRQEIERFRPEYLEGGSREYPLLSAHRTAFIRAGERPRFAILTDYRETHLAPFDALLIYSKLARYFASDGRVRLRKGDSSGSESFRAAALWCRHLLQEPTFLALFTGTAAEQAVLGTLRHSLEDSPPNPDAVRAAKKVLAILGPPVDLKPCVASEYNMSRWLSDVPKDESFVSQFATVETNSVADRVLQTDLVANRLLVEILGRLRKLHALLPDDPTDLATIERALKEATADSPTSDAFDVVGVGESARLSYFDNLHRVIGDRIARFTILESLILVAERRVAGEPPPTTLPIGSRGGLDPYSGRPLQYTVVGQTVTIRSLGANKTDDTGRSGPYNDDIEMSLEF
jgi:hypothetical protein